MKIVLFGATGIIGTSLIHMLIGKNHEVIAYGRNVLQKITPIEKLELVQASYFDDDAIAKAISGCDAVIAALEGGNDLNDVTRSLGMKKITHEMEKAGIKRIIALGGQGILNDASGKFLFEADDFPEAEIPLNQEHLKAFEYLKASALSWTMVCSPDILHLPETGAYHLAVDMPAPGSNAITVGDLAAFIVNELSENKYLNVRVGIAN